MYTNLRGISGTPLRDSFHLGQSIVNDYGRPYQGGFDNYSGFSARAVAGRFSFYFRGEGQHAPSAVGYSSTLAAYLSNSIDLIPFATNPRQDTIPLGPISSLTAMRVMEANLSYHLMGHEFSFGKSDQWLGPAKGASMLWSNNAENIYAFQINRVEPLRIPLLSYLTGPFRYEFFVGSLKGHTYPFRGIPQHFCDGSVCLMGSGQGHALQLRPAWRADAASDRFRVEQSGAPVKCLAVREGIVQAARYAALGGMRDYAGQRMKIMPGARLVGN